MSLVVGSILPGDAEGEAFYKQISTRSRFDHAAYCLGWQR